MVEVELKDGSMADMSAKEEEEEDGKQDASLIAREGGNEGILSRNCRSPR